MFNKNNTNLKDFVDQVCDDSHLRVENDLGDGYFRLRAEEAQKRQAAQDIRSSEDIVVEMMRNSRDAGAKNIFVATNTELHNRNIIIIDDGDGVPEQHHKTIFEPYVTSKLNSMTKDIWGIHGRGMALYSILENSESAYVVCSCQDIGCSIKVITNTNKLTEKRDQSSFPSFHINEDSELCVRGPKNILRTCAEFAIENRDKVNVYVGSPVEIAATLYNLSYKHNNINVIFNEPDLSTKITEYLAYASDVNEFKSYAMKLGINLSKRTARRIMDQEIQPQIGLLERISKQGIVNNSKNNNNKDFSKINKVTSLFGTGCKNHIISNTKKIKISKEDKQMLKKAVEEEFSNIASKYYLNKDINPEVSIHNNKLKISFDIIEQD